MENLLQQLLGILVDSPGNLIYHLTLAFSVFAALQTALINRHGKPGSGRILLGLNLILIAQLALFLTSGLSWQQIVNGHIFLPIFDRAVIVFSLLWLGWLWAFPTSHRIADIAVGVLNLGVLILFFFTYSEWSREGASLDFNNTWQDWTWCFTGIGVLVVSIIAVLYRRPEGWAIGFGMALLNLAGLLAHIFFSNEGGDFGGFIRLAQLAAYPLLPGLLSRLNERPATAPALSGQPTPKESSEQPVRTPRITDPRSVHAWIALNMQQEPAQVCYGIARAVAQSLLADLCFVATAPTDGYNPVILQGGYDLIREEDVPGTILEQAKIPTLTAALQKGKATRIMASESHTADLKSMAEALRLKEAGNLLFLPLTQNNQPWGGLILLSPYSNRSWSSEDQNYLAAESESLTAILVRSQAQSSQRQEAGRLKESLAAASREADDLRQQNQQLLNDISNVRHSSDLGTPAHPDIEALLAVQKETQDALTVLQAENVRLKNLVPKNNGEIPANADVNQMERELRTVLQEIARLQNQLVQANSRVVELERQNRSGSPMEDQDREMIASVVQDLRQPMSSIMGYTDLLLAESIGILGKAQKKFLEHIRSSADRLRGLIDDLVQISSAGGSAGPNAVASVDLSEIIDGALSELSPQLLERGIQINVDLPDQLPPVYADRDSLHQITAHLLQNAGAVSPLDGTISLSTSRHRDDASEYIIFKITDSGGGIPTEDISRVFSKRFRNDTTPIQGVGDGGVGLTIVKTLVDAIGGRIWVESQAGQGSTYSVLLPTHPSSVRETS
jgi:signal transduction histidine kinase